LDRPIGPHMVRHATGTELAAAGVPIDVVQDILGHRSIESTRVYVHSSQRRLRDAVEGQEARSASRIGAKKGGRW
jgi:integrase/recombinase XerD